MADKLAYTSSDGKTHELVAGATHEIPLWVAFGHQNAWRFSTPSWAVWDLSHKPLRRKVLVVQKIDRRNKSITFSCEVK